MQHRTFGRTGWEVSEIGYGMWGLAGWTGSNKDETGAALQLSVDLGCNFFDTAWGYGAGASERILGDLVRANPDKRLYTASKIPPKNFKWPSRRGFCWKIASRPITSASTPRKPSPISVCLIST